MNAVRLNMSHATYEEAEKAVGWVKTLNRQAKYPVPIMLDTNGPEVRTGIRSIPLSVRPNEKVTVGIHDHTEKESAHPFVQIPFPGFFDAANEGDSILIDNGLITLTVLKKTNAGLECRVNDGGEIGSKRHVNFPGIHVDLPSISEKDREDVEFAKSNDVSFIAQSFVRSPEDIVAMRELISSRRDRVKIIAKIENEEGVAAIDEIAKVADAIMVARGDLGIETNMAALPNLQRNLVRTTLRNGRRCIVATHLLESMIENPIPTRAEVIDVANAVYEGVDAVMLSGETSVGRYPVRAVRQMVRIAEESERVPTLEFSENLVDDSDSQHLARSAVELAERTGAVGIVVITRRGLTADLVTNCGPQGVPIFAFSNLSHTRRRLMMNRGVYSHRIAFSSNPERTVKRALSVLRCREDLDPEQKLVVISDVVGVSGVDSIQLRFVGEELSEDDGTE